MFVKLYDNWDFKMLFLRRMIKISTILLKQYSNKNMCIIQRIYDKLGNITNHFIWLIKLEQI